MILNTIFMFCFAHNKYPIEVSIKYSDDFAYNINNNIVTQCQILYTLTLSP